MPTSSSCTCGSASALMAAVPSSTIQKMSNASATSPRVGKLRMAARSPAKAAGACGSVCCTLQQHAMHTACPGDTRNRDAELPHVVWSTVREAGLAGLNPITVACVTNVGFCRRTPVCRSSSVRTQGVLSRPLRHERLVMAPPKSGARCSVKAADGATGAASAKKSGGSATTPVSNTQWPWRQPPHAAPSEPHTKTHAWLPSTHSTVRARVHSDWPGKRATPVTQQQRVMPAE
mmetsp:Transcript_1918/g.4406  ORF Transcript_1918/g.4406 Transcript_1918/m.4406 type:complete len:233 (+) Transcript_1918:1892-2590(+)